MLSLELRGVQTESLRPEQAADFLNAQRLKRPSSPHFTIYQPQLTWFASIANRITGVGLTVCALNQLPFVEQILTIFLCIFMPL